MPFSIDIKPEYVLTIHHRPDFTLLVFLIFILLMLAPFFLAKGSAMYLLYGICALIICFVCSEIFLNLELLCVIDKQSGVVSFKRGGVLGTHIRSRSLQFALSELETIVMKRHVNRGGDTFQVLLFLKNDINLELTRENLNFRTCQNYSEKIRNFLGIQVPVIAVD